jgi:hypothetical protein
VRCGVCDLVVVVGDVGDARHHIERLPTPLHLTTPHTETNTLESGKLFGSMANPLRL